MNPTPYPHAGMQTGGITYPSMNGPGYPGTQPPMQPGMPQPGMAQPGMAPAYPQQMYPGTMQPGIYQPGMAQPGMYQPVSVPVPTTGYPQPGMYQPGMTQPMIPGMAPCIGAGDTKSITYQDAEDACRRLYGAFKGVGTDNKEVIAVLSSFNKAQLNEISMVYSQKYGKNLAEALKSELTGAYEQLALAILYPPFKMEAHFVSQAIKKKKLDDADAIGEILATRTPSDLQQIALAYQVPAFGRSKKDKKKSKSFVEFVLEGTSSHKDLNNFSRAILTRLRPTTDADPRLAAGDAKDLIIAAKGAGTDEAVFFDILAHRSYCHISKIAEEVQVQKKKSLKKLIEAEFSRVMERTLLYVLHMAQSPAHAQAYIIYRAVKGAGTRDDALIRTIAYIYDNDMLEKVKVAFREISGKDLVKYVESDTTMNYRKLCVALLNFRGKKLTVPMNVGYK
eukprot:gnl/Chilomastix_caulleri/376.p1 GENE.gnl/Chilomastix_caulleri/376~~gnl/Chilomastix_caulleri/376.p1  ORF type:complete len:450 (+),score=183.66 gnl/Chilomastix_caulleri/376:76-1425(+)